MSFKLLHSIKSIFIMKMLARPSETQILRSIINIFCSCQLNDYESDIPN